MRGKSGNSNAAKRPADPGSSKDYSAIEDAEFEEIELKKEDKKTSGMNP
ncbi:MAG: hypothetical protein LAT67_03145 [Balneolales bacterium]|nr:hypothetical protein [Balneolales bacterium]